MNDENLLHLLSYFLHVFNQYFKLLTFYYIMLLVLKKIGVERTLHRCSAKK